MNTPITGGCLCGAVRYEITAPVTALRACHCLNCQKHTGSGGSVNAVVPKDSFRITKGEPKKYDDSATQSGRTLSRLCDLLQARNPRSLDICALLHKHIADELRHPTRFIGFDAPHEFLVGYGLDHAEHFRHLPYIASLQ